MKLLKFSPKKNAAQAIVEFAIVLPILLLLLYGILEAGRLLFMYSTIVTASRQASRYGASTGAGTGGAKRFRDCDGIRLAANSVDYLNAFDHTGTDVKIEYDDGVDASGNPIPHNGADGNNTCDGASDPNVEPSTNNTTRVTVTVTGHFKALVPLVPFGDRTIEAKSSRTILMSVSIVVPNPAAATTATDIQLSPHREPPPQPHSQLGEIVTATVNVTATSGTPTGTVEVRVTDTATSITNSICTLSYSGSTITCPINFNSLGTFVVEAIYTPNSAAFLPSSSNEYQVVGKASTTTTVTDTPDPSVQGNPVNIHVAVTSIFGIPTGTVEVTSAAGNCTVTLDATGQGNCSVTYTSLGTTLITAVYSDDAQHLTSDDTASHEVLAGTATPSNTPPPPTATFTSPPETATLTAPPPTMTLTPVVGCSNIQVPTGETIILSAKTMYLNIYNPQTYDVTIKDVFLRWNYLQGFNGKDLHLVGAQLNTNIFWTGDVHAPSYSPPLSTTVIIPAGSLSRITFTFDKLYTRSDGEQIQISFSTPGCEDHTINVVKPK